MKKLLPFVAFIFVAATLFTVFSTSGNTTDSNITLVKGKQSLVEPTSIQQKSIDKNTENWSMKKRKVKGVDAFDQPDMYVKFQNEIRTPKNATAPLYEAGYRVREFDKAKQNISRLGKTTELNWVERGPGNVGGRTRALIIDPHDATHNTWIAGAVSGGIWKTTNSGETWTEIAPDIPNMAVTTLAMSKSNNSIIYAGTGEGFYNSDATNGNGIFKSVDRGATWTHLSSTVGNLNFQNINRIIVDPNDPDVVLACSNNSFWLSSADRTSGIYKSVDGGASWTTVYTSNSRVQQVIADPDNFNIIYATENGVGVLKSVDAGNTWAASSTGITAGARFELAVSPTNTNRLFLAAESTPSVLYYSNDAGANWTPIIDPVNAPANWLGAQGWYDNCLVVNPFDENTVYLGGINVWKATLLDGITPYASITEVQQNNTSSFLAFVNWGGGYAGGGFDVGANFLGSYGLEDDDYTSVELRFGPGIAQKAYRYVRNGSTGDYEYQDFIEVPMQAWDTDNNQQITLSFRDAAGDGALDFGLWGSASWREYVFINAVPYSEDVDSNFTVTWGALYKNTYAFWPYLPDGQTWDPDNLPESNLSVTWEVIPQQNADFTRLTNWYAGEPHPDGGTYPYVHADHHIMLTKITSYKNQTFLLVNGNDGGVEYTRDGGTTWEKTLNGYVTTQFYGIDKKPGANEYIGGMQDNGTWQSAMGEDANQLTSYTRVLSGDGYEVSWNYDNPDLLIGSLYNTRPYKSTDGGYNWSVANNGLADYDNGPFITSFGTTKSDPDLIFTTGPSGVWRSDNFGSTWTLAPIDADTWGYSTTKTNIQISIADPQIVWAGSYLDDFQKVFVSVDGGLTFNPVNTFEGTQGRITNIETHPTDRNTAYLIASFAKSPKIMKTTDLGQTWEDITGFVDSDVSTNGFPDVATYCMLVMPYNTDILWAGTEIGIIESLDGGESWALADNGYPAVHTWMMKIVDDQIVVGTHGRGIWTVDMPELADYAPPVAVKTPRLDDVSQAPTGEMLVFTSLRSDYDSTKVFLNGEASFTTEATTVDKFTFSLPVTENNTYEVQVVSYKDGVEYKSSTQTADVYVLNDPVEEYANDLNGETGLTDFTGTALVQAEYDGFSNAALHSVHPCVSNMNATTMLLVPVAITSDDATLHYKDIAIIEPGEDGVAYGEYGFWDYVIVEGTKDGTTWIPLLDGYDCNLYEEWRTAYDTDTDPDSSLFKAQSIVLSDFFEVGDNALIRFRIFTDGNTEGWGWVIDDIQITQTITGLENEDVIPTSYSLSQNYPNPFNPTTTIQFALPQKSVVKLAIYDAIGQLVKTVVSEELTAGHHQYQWNASNIASGIYFYRIEAGNFVETKKMILLK